MTFAEVRKQFVLLSGRYDLVIDTDTFANNSDGIGADWFIQQGQKFLDRLAHTGKHQEAKWNFILTAGTTRVSSAALRAVKSVRLETSTASLFLTNCLYEDLRTMFGDVDGFPATSPETPSYYANVSMRDVLTPTAATESEAGIFIMPPPDVDYTLEVLGVFDSAPMVADTDENYWSVIRPETLIQSAYYTLEKFYRNTQGMKDHLDALLEDVKGIDHDDVEESIAGRNVMQDSWNF